MNTLIVFVKYPEPGKVKTRIARELGDEAAAVIYSIIAERVIERVSASDEYETVIFFDPPEMANEVRQWVGRSDVTYEPQSGVTIGERMLDAFEKVFSVGAERAVLIGTDVPSITAETVTEAFRGLEYEDAVMGPSADGGYYLLALKKPEPALFDDIEWGSGSVYQKTLDHIEKLNLSYKSLDILRDIDSPEDIGPEILGCLTDERKFRYSK